MSQSEVLKSVSHIYLHGDYSKGAQSARWC